MMDLLAMSEETKDAIFAGAILGVIAFGMVIAALWRSK